MADPALADAIGELDERPAPHDPTPDLLVGKHNDSGNADRLIALHGKDLRYCYPLKKWLVWDGRRWAVDKNGQAQRFAKLTMVEFQRQAIERGDIPAQNFARSSLDARRITNMLAMAECEINVDLDNLDQNPYLMNFLNGTVDLRSGEKRPHKREDFITKVVRYDYDPEAKCPLFLSTLARLMGARLGANEAALDRARRLVLHLQKAIGYSLTGSTREKTVFLCFGDGNNGKTTFLSLFLDLLKEYSALLQVDTLMVRQENSNSQADLADLRGARFVMTSETEEGQRLAEGKLKRITQGMGKIKATRKYENPIEFPETHKLWMDTNHKPMVRGADNAIWNRLHLLPFTEDISDEVDTNLPEKLIREATGILNWSVQGAIKWTKEGLGRVPELEIAAKQYRNDMDQVGRFISECCIVLPTAQVGARPLYKEYRRWAEDRQEHPISEKEFGPRVEARFTKRHTESGSVYGGIGLKADA